MNRLHTNINTSIFNQTSPQISVRHSRYNSDIILNTLILLIFLDFLVHATQNFLKIQTSHAEYVGIYSCAVIIMTKLSQLHSRLLSRIAHLGLTENELRGSRYTRWLTELAMVTWVTYILARHCTSLYHYGTLKCWGMCRGIHHFTLEGNKFMYFSSTKVNVSPKFTSKMGEGDLKPIEVETKLQ